MRRSIAASSGCATPIMDSSTCVLHHRALLRRRVRAVCVLVVGAGAVRRKNFFPYVDVGADAAARSLSIRDAH